MQERVSFDPEKKADDALFSELQEVFQLKDPVPAHLGDAARTVFPVAAILHDGLSDVPPELIEAIDDLPPHN